MNPIFEFDRKRYYVHLSILIAFTGAIPTYLLLHLDKISIERWTWITFFLCALGALIYFLVFYPLLQDVKNMNRFAPISGKFVGYDSTGYRSRRFQAYVEVIVDGRKITFLAKRYSRNFGYSQGSTCQVLFNPQQPEESIIVEDSLFIKEKKSLN